MERFILMNGTIKNWIIKYRVHLIAWSCFIFWESIIIGLMYGAFGKFGNYVVHYIVNILLFYVHTWLLEKALSSPRQVFWKLPLFIIIELFIYTSGVLGMDILLIKYTDLVSKEFITISLSIRIYKLVWRCWFFMLFSTGYYFLKRYINEKNEKERIEKQRFQMLLDKERMDKELVMSKNAFLKAQINPHLLFNTFEFIHQKIKQHSPEDALVMVYLSDMMRFAASTEHNEGYVTLGEEIEQCQNLIKLYQLTQGRVFIELGFSPDVQDIKLIPLVLLTLLENMFKHGNLSNGDYKATIDIYMDGGLLKIESRNLPALVKSKVGFGSGLVNVNTRLDYTYGNHTEMNAFIDEEGFYTLTIAIKEKALRAAFPGEMEQIIYQLK